ncbi:flagellar biosynthetic protein FliO [Jiella pacifica]|uniref:Flagellar biosynthesis protein, FliO n=1 Tax=Jiella pacifica TaxID=2696469 RepID=A0A6N9TDI3_9HYPH|nr:flagellar biosynthetic protein FliO [Jiella pacifica]NDW06928.1 hypothetical protein [Jiella pacifica]
MPQWLVDLFGASLAPIVWVALVAAMVCILAIVVMLLARRLLANGATLGPRMRAPRLQVVDVARVDDKRKLVLVRRDDVEHLVLVGGQTDILVEASITRLPASTRPTRSEDARLDVPAVSPGAPTSGRREPVAPPLTASRQGQGPETAMAERAPAPSGRWPQAAPPADRPAPAIAAEPRPAPAPREPAETAPPRSRGTADEFPLAEPRRPNGDGQAGSAQTRAAETRQPGPIRQPAPVPSVEMPLKPTEPPALNPSTMAFSRATPTLRSKTESDSLEAPGRPQNEIEPELAIPEPATRPVPPRQDAGSGGGGTPPAIDAPKVDPAPRGPSTDLGAHRPAPSAVAAERRPTQRPAASSGEEGRPLSVRSFASAIQSRRYGRPETQSKPPEAATTAPASSRAGDGKTETESREAAGRSIEDFLSADLSLQLSQDIDAAFAEPSAPPAAASPRPAPTAPAPRPAAAPERASEAAAGPARADTAPDTTARQAPAGGEGTDAGNAPADPKAPRRETDPRPAPPPRAPAASDPGKTAAATTPAAATASPVGAPAPAVATDDRPEPQPRTTAPQPKATASSASATANASDSEERPTAVVERPPSPVAAPANSARQPRPPQEIDLEEEMKRLLGELDLDGPSEQRKA